MGKINENHTVIRSDDMMTANLDGEIVMMSIERGNYYGLNQVSTKIWESLAEPISIAELCANLQSHFDVDPEKCKEDVLAFLNELHDEGMVLIVDPKAS